MTGRELAERLRQLEPDLPILFMSFLPKPVSLQKLFAAVEKALGTARHQTCG